MKMTWLLRRSKRLVWILYLVQKTVADSDLTSLTRRESQQGNGRESEGQGAIECRSTYVHLEVSSLSNFLSYALCLESVIDLCFRDVSRRRLHGGKILIPNRAQKELKSQGRSRGMVVRCTASVASRQGVGDIEGLEDSHFR